MAEPKSCIDSQSEGMVKKSGFKLSQLPCVVHKEWYVHKVVSTETATCPFTVLTSNFYITLTVNDQDYNITVESPVIFNQLR